MDVRLVDSTDDIALYLVSRLDWLEDDARDYEGDWTQVMGFRRAFQAHQVWRSSAGKFAFHVSDGMGSDEAEFHGEGNMGTYDTFTQLLNGVSTQYHELWTRLGGIKT